MKTTILLFDGVTPLDAVGPYEVLSRLPGAEVTFVAKAVGPKRAETGGLALMADRTLDDVKSTDVLLIPGGPGTRQGTQPPIHDAALLEWICSIDETTLWTTSVCTGTLVLAATGLLNERWATTHWLHCQRLADSGAESIGNRVVFDGKFVTAAGVSAGIDMALWLVRQQLGDEKAKAVQLSIEYDPQPPFDTGSPRKAPRETVELVRNAALGSAVAHLSRRQQGRANGSKPG